MNTKQLSYFLEVLRSGGFSSAARVLNIAQPALSGHVAALETELGTKLLIRSSRGVTPTSAGVRLGAHAEAILRQLDAAKHDVSSASGGPSGNVLVALPATAAHLVAGPLIQRVEAQLPRVHLRIIEGLSTQSGDVMASGRGDLGIVPNASEIPNLEAVALFTESLFLIGKWDGKGKREGKVSLRKLSDYSIAQGGHRTSLRRVVEEAALANDVRLQTLYPDVGGLFSLLSMVEQGLCHTIGNWPLTSVRWDHGTLSAKRIVSPMIGRPISIVWPKDRPVTDAIAGVRSLLTELLDELVESNAWRGQKTGFDHPSLA